MAKTPDEIFNEKMEALRAQYLTSIADWQAELTLLKAAPDTLRLTTIAHSIAGSAAIYGYEELGNLARELENALLEKQMYDVLLNAVIESCADARQGL